MMATDQVDRQRNSVQWIMKRTSSTRKSISRGLGKMKSWGQKSQASEWEIWDRGCDFMNFLILKILFWDIVISIGDGISDFAQGINLIMTEKQAVYGYLTIAINWLPGLVAVFHLLSSYRAKIATAKLFLYSMLLLLFYPLVPTLAFVRLLWKRPKLGLNQESNAVENSEFQEAQYQAKIAHSITGGIESPIQLILQIWMILNGKIPAPFSLSETPPMTVDWHGNKISVPTISSISMIFSGLSIFKAIIQFNIINEHIRDISSMWSIVEIVVKIFDYGPFFVIGAFFRIATVSVLITYLNVIGFVPIGIIFFINLAIGYSRFDFEKIPLWLITCVSLFMPVHFVNGTITERSRPRLIAIQSEIFFYQSLAAVVVYLPALLACFGKVNYDSNWLYDPKVILNNQQFNAIIILLVLVGVMSFLLSIRPDWSELIQLMKCAIFKGKEESQEDDTFHSESTDFSNLRIGGGRKILDSTASLRYLKETLPRFKSPCKRVCKGLCVLLVVLAPIFSVALYCLLAGREIVYISRRISDNETVSIQGVVLQGSQIHSYNSTSTEYMIKMFDAFQEREIGPLQPPFPHNRNMQIYIMDRFEGWEECKKMETCIGSASAIMITDGHDRGYLPSYPPISLDDVPSQLPIYLVQEIDADVLFGLETRSSFKKLSKYLFCHNKDHFPTTNYDCDLSPKECLPKYGKSLVDSDSKKIRGQQYRTVKCFWGGETCNGFKNEKEKEMFCDDSLIKERFCKTNNIVFTQHDDTSIKDKRQFRAMRSRSENFLCLNEMNVDKCDEDNDWTDYVRCEVAQDRGSKRRYCAINYYCLLEEIHYVDPKNCL
ncbi:hypothetical protein TCAL_11594 [Tigriopus californicus]|uniref:Uncharacterized protein n=1 Tax=Tigriopus californicus TaxID=6832 RepID=A0A553PLW0_TIGCA|nr:uncharacterized protein LOC131889769 isoform X2 [Tigriopus californicus]TRY78671.1 hypothetical protein TCAL_11594 [Tigriopus californicus]